VPCLPKDFFERKTNLGKDPIAPKVTFQGGLFSVRRSENNGTSVSTAQFTGKPVNNLAKSLQTKMK
jgi:hypothetical protein